MIETECKNNEIRVDERDDIEEVVVIPGEGLKFIPKRYDDCFHCII
jgi:hypothetical protein